MPNMYVATGFNKWGMTTSNLFYFSKKYAKMMIEAVEKYITEKK